MKKTLIFIWTFFCFNFSFGQIEPDAELAFRLHGKTKFADIKKTVNAYLNEKAKLFKPSESIILKGINRQLKMWNRQFWMSENYTNAAGELVDANELNYAAYQKMNAEHLNLQRNNEPLSQPQNWILQGPYNGVDGLARMDRIAFHPTNPNIMFAGSPHGGIFKTINGGDNWFPISQFLASLGISGIVIHPVNPNIIYVLTGDGNSNGGCFNGNACLTFGQEISSSLGVFKTTDGGLNWFRTGKLDPSLTSFQGRELIMDPTNPEILIAATSIGLFRTQDGGITWTKTSTGINYWDIKFNPSDRNIIYATSSGAFWKSTNNGVSFVLISIAGISTATRISIAVTPANRNKVMLLAGQSVANGGILTGVFSSSTSGDNFNLIYRAENLFNNYIDVNNENSQIDYNNTIAISPVNENVVVVGGLCIWNSSNGGNNWDQATAYHTTSGILHEYIHPDQHSLAYHPNGTLYVANDGGIYKSTNNGDDWNFISNGLSASQFYHFERENDEGDIWGGTQDNGILEQIGTSGNYYTYRGGDGYDVMTDNEYTVADGEGDDIYYSLNAKIMKDCASIGDCDISVPGNTNFFANLAMSPDLEDKIYAGYQNGTYISFNAGVNWSLLGGSSRPGNWCISACPSNTEIVYAAGEGQINRYMFPAGWTNITAALQTAGYNSTLKITDIDVHPADANTVYISIGGAGVNAKAFVTFNGGISWYNITLNLPDVPVFSIKRDNNDGVYAGTSIGIFYKRNGVNRWEPFGNGLPPVPITEIELWPVSNEIWVSTFGRGIWYTTQYGNCPTNITLTVEANGNYYKEASDNITSSQLIKGGDGTYVKYNAGKQIKLTSGFKVSFGSKFRTFNTGCGGAVDLNKNIQQTKNNGIQLKSDIIIKKIKSKNVSKNLTEAAKTQAIKQGK